jgi:hypothetical protein
MNTTGSRCGSGVWGGRRCGPYCASTPAARPDSRKSTLRMQRRVCGFPVRRIRLVPKRLQRRCFHDTLAVRPRGPSAGERASALRSASSTATEKALGATSNARCFWWLMTGPTAPQVWLPDANYAWRKKGIVGAECRWRLLRLGSEPYERRLHPEQSPQLG